MPRLIFALVVAFAGLSVLPAAAQLGTSGVRPAVLKVASANAGAVSGIVRDGSGQGIADARVIALGATAIMARSDARGHFTISLPVGDYVLRAAREGYLSKYREAIQIRSDVRVERNITLVRLDRLTTAEPILAALGKADAAEGVLAQPVAVSDTHAHTATAWWLRRLPRSVLRDTAEPARATERAGAGEFQNPLELLDRAVTGSARAAASFFADTDFSGQINFLTTGYRGVGQGWRPEDAPRGIAYVAIGAPVGSRGNWRVRGSVAPGTLASWVLHGEYTAAAEQRHAVRFGLSYGVQGNTALQELRSGVAETRAVGVAHFLDRWRVSRRVELDYGLRLNRFDYVASPSLLSPDLGLRVSLRPQTTVVVALGQQVTAPGATEFLPPVASGPWLPPDRTFSTLVPAASFRAERVRHYAVGLEQSFGAPATERTLFLRRFIQSTRDQAATLFGSSPGRDVGHYYVASAGDAEIDGWQIGARGALRDHVSGLVEYSASRATWTAGGDAHALRWFAPSLVRADELLHDLAFSLLADLPDSSTAVRLSYRMSSGFSRPTEDSIGPTPGGRFDVEVRQGLPYQPIRGGRLELLFAVRTLFADVGSSRSLYDELLAVAPPLRLIGGVQIRF